MTQEIARRDESLEAQAGKTLFQWLKKYEKSITKVLPERLNAERMQWLVVNSVRTTPALAGVTPPSFINAVLLASNLGIEIRKNSAYLIPFGKECQLLIDYRAKIDIAQRAGVTIYPPQLVRELDEFEYGYNETGLFFKHQPPPFGEPRGEVKGGWCAAKNRLGERIVDIMELAEIEKIRSKSKKGCFHDFMHYNSPRPGLKTLAAVRAKAAEALDYKDPYNTPWVVWWDGMAEKTLVHSLFNRVPQNEEMARSQEIDEAVETGMVVQAPQMFEFPDDIFTTEPLVEGGFEPGHTPEERTEAVRQSKDNQAAAARSKTAGTGKEALAEVEIWRRGDSKVRDVKFTNDIDAGVHLCTLSDPNIGTVTGQGETKEIAADDALRQINGAR